MAYGTPTDPVAGTVITVAYAVANILDPIRWLRQMTGNADPPGSNYVVVSSSTTATAWSKITTDLINNGAVTDAKLATPKVTKAGDTMSGMLDFSSDGVGVRLSQSGTLVDYNTDGTTLFAGDDVFRVLNQAANVGIFRAANADAAPTFKGYTIWHSNNTDLAVTAAKLASDAVETAKIKDLNVTTGKLADLAVTAAKIAANTITASQIQNNTIGNSQLVGGTAVANLGFTPSRIASGTYSGNGSTSGRQVTTGFAVKLVVIHDSANDTMYIAINTTNSIRLGPSPTFVQGSSSVHVHASDGFTVGDGTSQGNVTSNSYSYTAFG